MNLHNRLRDLRLQNNLTQRSLADFAGVTRRTIIAIEKGIFGPSVRLALKLASILNVSVEDIFWLDDDRGEMS